MTTVHTVNAAGTITGTTTLPGPSAPNPAAVQRIAVDGSCWWEWLDENGVLQTIECEVS